MAEDFRGLEQPHFFIHDTQCWLVGLSRINDLFKFCVISDIAVLVNTACIEASASHSPFPPRNKGHTYFCRKLLASCIALNQRHTPVGGDFLGNESLTNCVVPHEASFNFVPAWRILSCFLLFPLLLPLKGARQIEINSEVESIFQVSANFVKSLHDFTSELAWFLIQVNKVDI